MVVIDVDDVSPGSIDPSEIGGKEHAMRLTNGTAESFSHQNAKFLELHCETSNPLVAAVHTAFAQHLPLIITPDAIFNTILQGISEHVEKNAEALRAHFVAHEGKKKLVVRDDSLVSGSWNNGWPSVIQKFMKQLLTDMSGDKAKEILNTRFTTSTAVEMTAHTLAFMDVVKSYYDYEVRTLCGIPQIDIRGDKADWIAIDKVVREFLPEIGLQTWSDELQKILKHFVAAFDQPSDKAFWRGVYKYHGRYGSGGVAKATGWIGKLFPYIRGSANKYLTVHEDFTQKQQSPLESRQIKGIPLSEFPAGLTETEFKWVYFTEEIPMFFRAGLVGVSVENGALKPEVGWIIAKQTNENSKPPSFRNSVAHYLKCLKK